MPDIYFAEKFAEINKNNDEEVECFEVNNEYGYIKHLFIKRKITQTMEGKQYYDLITPYGYGGPIIIKSIDKNKLIESFKCLFSNYCLENNIVTEFVRFHPILENHDDFRRIYDPIFMRKTVGTNLKDFIDPIMSEFSKSCKKNIRKSLNEGVEYKINESIDHDTLKKFIKIYYATMDRNKADDFYYFDQLYFEKLLLEFKNNIIITEALYDNRTIAAGFYFIYKDMIHMHLSGTLNEYLYLSPAYILRYATTKWGKENGYKLIHHGGGTTNSEKDSLYLFKKRFGRHTEFDYFVAKKIWNQDIYNYLIKNFKNQDNDFFPLYRINNIRKGGK